MDKLQELAKASQQYYDTKKVGLNDTERSALARQSFATLQGAFEAITEEASKGNQTAFQAVSNAIQIPELQDPAIHSLGILAGNGNETALQILLNPKDHHVLPSDTVGALKPAADQGNQKAIDALAAVAADQSQHALWFTAADGLGNAAAAGNSVAIDALVAMSGDTNENARRVVMSGLRRASSNQNAKATTTLLQMKAQ